MFSYLLWNPYKVSQYLNIEESAQNVKSILRAENSQNHSVSTIIDAKSDTHANQIATAILNECDCNVRVEPVPTNLEIVIYRKADYDHFQAACEDCATYPTGIFLSLSDLISKPELVKQLMNAFKTTSMCINGDLMLIEAVLIDRDDGDSLLGKLKEFLV